MAKTKNPATGDPKDLDPAAWAGSYRNPRVCPIASRPAVQKDFEAILEVWKTRLEQEPGFLPAWGACREQYLDPRHGVTLGNSALQNYTRKHHRELFVAIERRRRELGPSSSPRKGAS